MLDHAFLATLESADIVCSWGVLHHTGAIWEAVRNAARLMRPDAAFFISLYNRISSSEYSTEMKRRYNRAGKFKKRLMEAAFIFSRLVRPNLLAPWKGVAYVREYKKSRGMSYMHDVRDWLGGYPFEVSSVPEVLKFMRDELDLEWVNLNPNLGQGCSEYLFARYGSPWIKAPRH